MVHPLLMIVSDVITKMLVFSKRNAFGLLLIWNIRWFKGIRVSLKRGLEPVHDVCKYFSLTCFVLETRGSQDKRIRYVW